MQQSKKEIYRYHFVIGWILCIKSSGLQSKEKPYCLQLHHAVCLWFKVQHIFNCGAIIFLPVPPTLCSPNNIISLFSKHSPPTFIFPSQSISFPLTCTYLLNIAVNLPTPHTYYHKKEKETNESQQTKGLAAWAIGCRGNWWGLSNAFCSSWW